MIRICGRMMEGLFSSSPETKQTLSEKAAKVMQYAKDNPIKAVGWTLVAAGGAVISIGAAPVATAAATTQTVTMVGIGALTALGGGAVLVYDSVEKKSK